MFGCAAFGVTYFGDSCFEAGAPVPPAGPRGGASYPLPPPLGREKRPADVDEFALLLALGYVE